MQGFANDAKCTAFLKTEPDITGDSLNQPSQHHLHLSHLQSSLCATWLITRLDDVSDSGELHLLPNEVVTRTFEFHLMSHPSQESWDDALALDSKLLRHGSRWKAFVTRQGRVHQG